MSTPQISGPPFTPQGMPSTLPLDVRQSLANFLNLDTMGQAKTYYPPASTPTTVPTSTAPPITQPIVGTEWMKAISQVMGNLKDLLNFADVRLSLLNVEFWKNIALGGDAMILLRTKLKTQYSSETALYDKQQSEISAYSAAAATYNNALTTASNYTNAMYQNQQSYQAGTMTPAAYNAAVAQWNSTVAAQNTAIQNAYNNYVTAANTFSLQVAANNALISQLNASRSSNQIPTQITPQVGAGPLPAAPIPLPTAIPNGPLVAPFTIPAASLVPSSVPLISVPSLQPSTGISNPSTTSEEEFLSSYAAPQVAALMSIYADFAEHLTLLDAAHEYQLFVLGVKDNLIPNNAYIERAPQIFKSTSGGSTAPTGVGLTATIEGSHNPALGKLLAEAVLASVVGDILNPLPKPLVQDLSLLVMQSLQRAAVLAALPALQLLKNNLEVVAPDSPAVDAALSLTQLKALTGLIASGGLQANVTNLLSQSIVSPTEAAALSQAGLSAEQIAALSQSGLSSSEIASLSEKLTAALSLGILLTGVLQVAKAFGLPGLIPQLLGALPNIPGISDLIASIAGTGGVQDVLTNPASILILKGVIANELVNQGLTLLQAQQQANAIIDRVAADPTIQTDAQLRAAVASAALQQRPPSQATAETAPPRATPAPPLASPSIKPGPTQAELFPPTTSASPKPVVSTPPSSLSSTPTYNPLQPYQQPTQSTPPPATAFDALPPPSQFAFQALPKPPIQPSFSQTLTESLFSAPHANTLASIASDFVHREQLISGLDQAYIQRNLDHQSLQNSLFFQKDLQQGLAALSQSSFATNREFNDQLVSTLKSQGVAPQRATELANQATLAIQSVAPQHVFSSKNVDQPQFEKSLTSGLVAQGFTAENATGIASGAVANALATPTDSPLILRQALVKELVNQGVSSDNAESLAASSIIVPTHPDLLKTLGNGELLPPTELVSKLSNLVVNRLKGIIGTPQAVDFANQLGLVLFGTPPSPQQANINDINNSASVYYQAKDAVATLIKGNAENVVTSLHEDFKRFMKPNISLFDFSLRYLDPANQLVLSGAWGLMYAGSGSEPSNFKKSIDIRV